MEPFFNTVPDKYKLRLVDGTILHDTAIIPEFVPKKMADAAWDAVCARPDCDSGMPLTLDVANPRWVTGERKELNYRGHPIKRDKMWFQRETGTSKRYGYTGWQWRIALALNLLGSIPALAALVDAMGAMLGLTHKHNQWIVTRYATGADNIGLHSDKVKDWAEGSTFVVIKLGAPRPFVFTQRVNGVDVEIFNQVLQPGTAVIVGYNANQKVKHGVPAVEECGPSGSIVGRCITTEVEWTEVYRKIAASAQARERA